VAAAAKRERSSAIAAALAKTGRAWRAGATVYSVSTRTFVFV